MGQKVHLLIIDPQNDFCEKKGSLFVPGAVEDMSRLTQFIRKVGKKLDDIHVTLDSHHKVDIAHPIWWKDAQGNHPAPFTMISKDDVKTQKWTTTQPSFYTRSLAYVTDLEKNGRYPLVVWPEHCKIGGWGNNVQADLHAALEDWENDFAMVNYVTKGSNMWTEHYSPFKADVPDPTDASTQINVSFINALQDADFLAIAGEAGSHCLANAIRDIVDNASPEFAKKIVLLKDATSPVPGFEKFQDDMIRDMTARGMKISSTTEFLQ